MELINRYVPRTQFESYEDFKEHFQICVPERFDFARDIVDTWGEQEPDKLALLYCNDQGEELRLTFAQISQLSKQAATYFTKLGIGPGDRVLTLLRRRWEYWVCAVALHRIGAVVVPASIQLTEKDLAYRVQAAQVKLILTIDDSTVLQQLEGLFAQCSTLRDIAVVGEQIPAGYHDFGREFACCEPYEKPSNRENTDEMLLYFTSGTSGMPKMAVHNCTYPLGHIVTARFMQRVQNNGLHLTQSDSGWAKFGWGNIYGQWICGSAILGYDPARFDSVRLLAVMQRYQPTSLCVPPTMYRFLLRDGLKLEHVASVQWYSTAGEPLSGEVNREFHDITGHFIHEGYGQSEGTPICCTFEWVAVRPASMGKPSALYDTAIIHPDGSRCLPGEVGEIVLFVQKGQLGLLDCYCRDGVSYEAAQDGIYRTGDTAYEDADGYYWYVGRVDDMIKSSGYRIGPFEIESVLNSHPAVRESAIVGCPDEMRGQVVCAVVSLREGYQESPGLTKELQAYVKSNTAPYKYPRVIKYVDELPKTTSGKIIRYLARQIAAI